MICKLCLQEKSLIKKAHIIPNYLYDGLSDESKKMLFLKLDASRKENYYTGIFDSDILCKTCDNELLSKLENYAKNTIFNDNDYSKFGIYKETVFSYDGLESIRLGNLDYTKIKLFLLSLLWRASISKHPMFRHVDLGPHAEKMRKMILNNDGGSNDIYETGICKLKPNPNMLYRSMFEPRKISGNGNTWYLIHINHFLFHFNISPHNKQKIFDNLKIWENGRMDISLLEGHQAAEYFNSFTGLKNIRK